MYFAFQNQKYRRVSSKNLAISFVNFQSRMSIWTFLLEISMFCTAHPILFDYIHMQSILQALWYLYRRFSNRQKHITYKCRTLKFKYTYNCKRVLLKISKCYKHHISNLRIPSRKVFLTLWGRSCKKDNFLFVQNIFHKHQIPQSMYICSYMHPPFCGNFLCIFGKSKIEFEVTDMEFRGISYLTYIFNILWFPNFG